MLDPASSTRSSSANDLSLRQAPEKARRSCIGLRLRAFFQQFDRQHRRHGMDSQDQITTLNELIETTLDSVTGYEDSAKNIDNERLRETFRQRADERQQVVQELRAEVRRLGGDPEESGTLLGKAHQRFEDLKAAITGRDEKAIINEVERGEDYLKAKFETALEAGTLSGESRMVVERAYQSVRSGHDQISQLKHGLQTNS